MLNCTECPWKSATACRQCRAEQLERKLKTAEIKADGMEAIIRLPDYQTLPSQFSEN